ncbi:4-toluene sulfonate uptake permease [Raphidocelis subcapitata]|uniref:4-toluene sulfonate uptake permease n=1 Tax=Raphidocelis subcapitata TaxID=307507 RepID=A0A2V0P9M7_9CHLO|nr:4-toluene sulfonate uptake permease [Raphidocelis subcapitata]|eukprot:GBF95652.1 4-toluene sulfonate uptake permease [Raphidocelis subcapitata]
MRRAAIVLRQLQLQGGHAHPHAHPHASHTCGGALRGLATGLKDVEPKTLAKARRLALAVGTAAGAFGSLVGVGGGVLIVPAIVNACPSIPQRVISGTSLAAVVATGSTAGAVYLGSGLVDATSALLIAGGAVLTAPLGARYTARLNCQALRRLLGWWLIGVAPLVPAKALLLARDGDGAGGGDAGAAAAGTAAGSTGRALAAAPAGAAAAGTAGGDAGSGPARSTELLLRPLRPADAAIAATGCFAGFASGLLGIGGGTIVTPMLAVATSLPHAAVLGTSLAAMIPPSLVGLLQHARMGNVDVRMGAALAAGTAMGSYVGSAAALAAPPGVLEAVFAVGMAFLGRKTLQAANKAAAAAAKAAAAAAAK